MDLTKSIEPRSDQLNAEDLLSGSRTFTIADVREGSTEQPVEIHLVEHPGRPFKPSKTVRRILVAAWGPDSAAYIGRRMTLYRDASVKFGGMDVGGIRVSHLSDIGKPLTLALTVTRGKRAPHVVQPLREEARAPQRTQQPAQQQPDRRAQAVAAFAGLGVTEEQLVARVGKPVAEWVPADLDGLMGVYSELRADPSTVAQHFPAQEQVPSGVDSTTGEQLDVEEPPGEES